MPPPPPPFRAFQRPPTSALGPAPPTQQQPPPPPPSPPFSKQNPQRPGILNTPSSSNESDEKRRRRGIPSESNYDQTHRNTSNMSHTINRRSGGYSQEHSSRVPRRRSRSRSPSSRSSSSYSHSGSYSYSYSSSYSSYSGSDDERSSDKPPARKYERRSSAHRSRRSPSRHSRSANNSSGRKEYDSRREDEDRSRRDHPGHSRSYQSDRRYNEDGASRNTTVPFRNSNDKHAPSSSSILPSPSSSSSSWQSHAPLLPLPTPAPQRKLNVPVDLPLRFTVVADYVAVNVAAGGPAIEEEIRWRERRNPAYHFMTESLDSPYAVYYRWRLYSLLQGDSLLVWRTSPFQMEEGANNYWWIPPPSLLYGTDALRVVRERVKDGEVSGGRNTDEPHDEGKEQHSQSTLHSTPECATWLAAQCLSEGKLFDFLPQSSYDEWKAMMDFTSFVEHTRDHTTPEAPQTLEEYAMNMSNVLLSSDFVAERMAFLVDLQQRGVLHALSVVVDEVLHRFAELLDACGKKGANSSDEAMRTAVRCCFCALSSLFVLHDVVRNNNAVPLTTKEAAREANTEDQTNNAGSNAVSGGAEATETPSGGGAAAGGGGASSSSSALNRTTGRLGAWASSRNAQSKSGRGPASSTTKRTSGFSQQKNSALGRDFDKVLPILTESVLAIAMTTIQEFGEVLSTTAKSSATSLDGVSGGEMNVSTEEERNRRSVLESIQRLRTTAAPPLDAAQTVYHHVSACVPAHNESISSSASERVVVVRIALLLISWLHTLCSAWTDSDAVGTRCATTLLSTHGFFFSRQVELTGAVAE